MVIFHSYVSLPEGISLYVIFIDESMILWHIQQILEHTIVSGCPPVECSFLTSRSAPTWASPDPPWFQMDSGSWFPSRSPDSPDSIRFPSPTWWVTRHLDPSWWSSRYPFWTTRCCIVKYIEVRRLKWMNWWRKTHPQPLTQHFETPCPPSKMQKHSACCVPGEAFAANWGPDFSRLRSKGPCQKWRKLLRTSLSETC
jgi:hypothetical protein